ncbi:MAG: hypothetical protein Q7U02_13325 [Desulfosalsimonadaceae bacterium]|nr:hypothetical protein [Desulfosalsimonadaceae bacterium]
MKAFQKVSMMVVVVSVILVSGWAFASDPGFGDQHAQKNPPPPPNIGIHLLVKYEMDNMAVNVIAELTGQPVETIQASLAESDMRTLLEANVVNETLFRAAMKEKMLELVNEALANGRITQTQADEIIEKINTQPDAARP